MMTGDLTCHDGSVMTGSDLACNDGSTMDDGQACHYAHLHYDLNRSPWDVPQTLMQTVVFKTFLVLSRSWGRRIMFKSFKAIRDVITVKRRCKLQVRLFRFETH